MPQKSSQPHALKIEQVGACATDVIFSLGPDMVLGQLSEDGTAYETEGGSQALLAAIAASTPTERLACLVSETAEEPCQRCFGTGIFPGTEGGDGFSEDTEDLMVYCSCPVGRAKAEGRA